MGIRDILASVLCLSFLKKPRKIEDEQPPSTPLTESPTHHESTIVESSPRAKEIAADKAPAQEEPAELEAAPSDAPQPREAPASVASVNSSDEQPMYIAVMGSTGSGKTTFINAASGSSLRIGTGLESCTNEVQTSRPFNLDGRSVVLIDTPGFDDTTKSDTDVLRLIATSLVKSYKDGARLSGVIYMHRISDNKVGGASRLDFRMFQRLCGAHTYPSVLVVTNMWGTVPDDVALAREAELRTKELFFAPVLAGGALMQRHLNTRESAHAILRVFAAGGAQPREPITLQIQRELVDEGKDITETAAFAELNRDLMEQAERHRNDLAALQEEFDEAAREQDEETQKELQEEMERMEAELLRVRSQSQRLAEEYQEEIRRLDSEVGHGAPSFSSS